MGFSFFVILLYGYHILKAFHAFKQTNNDFPQTLSKDFNDHLSLIDTLNFDHKKIMNPEIILFGRYVCCCCYCCFLEGQKKKMERTKYQSPG